MHPVSLQLCPRTQRRPVPPFVIVLLGRLAGHRDLGGYLPPVPGMTGLELLGALRRIASAIPCQGYLGLTVP